MRDKITGTAVAIIAACNFLGRVGIIWRWALQGAVINYDREGGGSLAAGV